MNDYSISIRCLDLPAYKGECYSIPRCVVYQAEILRGAIPGEAQLQRRTLQSPIVREYPDDGGPPRIRMSSELALSRLLQAIANVLEFEMRNKEGN